MNIAILHLTGLRCTRTMIGQILDSSPNVAIYIKYQILSSHDYGDCVLNSIYAILLNDYHSFYFIGFASKLQST